MLQFSESALQDADVLVYVTDVVEKIDKNQDFLQKVQRMEVPILLLINKIDMSNQKDLTALVEEWHELLPQAEIIPISASNNFNVDVVLRRIKELLPDSPPFFDKDQLTDKPARFFVTEIIREKILRTLNKEIPHGTAVVIEEFKDEDTLIRIRAEIFCEKASHKGIIVGKNGASLKLIGTYAREDLEKLFGTKVYLNLWVKVKENWRESARTVSNFGYRDDN